MCDYQENVACLTCPKTIPSYFNYPIDNSCSQFLRCINGNGSLLECPDQLHFDSSKGECNFPDQVNCTIPDVICPVNSTPSNPTFVVDKKNCSMYVLFFFLKKSSHCNCSTN